MSETKYDFSHISEIFPAINALYEPDDRTPTDEETQLLQQAINGFLRTRIITELLDIYDYDTGGENPLSIHDLAPWLGDPFDKEMERRSVYIPDEVRDVLNIVHPEWAGKDNLKSRVDGMQKKLDKIVQILDSFQITMSVKDALNL